MFPPTRAWIGQSPRIAVLVSIEELLSELFLHWLVLCELEADLSIWLAWCKQTEPYLVNAIVHSASYLLYVAFLFATLVMFY